VKKLDPETSSHKSNPVLFLKHKLAQKKIKKLGDYTNIEQRSSNRFELPAKQGMSR